jgi:uncharacterized protein (TIGR02996 family)
MSDESALLAAIVANPNELVPRMMLADLLQEQGRAQEAEDWRRRPHQNSPFASLVGRTVRQVKFNGDHLLTLLTDEGPIGYRAEGDCCSWSWYYRILNPENLIDQKVVAVSEGRTDDVDPNDGLGQQEDDQVYGYCLMTAKGATEITFRNSSNGYYGGWIKPVHTDLCNTDSDAVLTESWVHPPKEKAVMGCGAPTGDCDCAQCLFPTGGQR